MDEPIAMLQREAPWLGDPTLGTCIVGSQALAIACRQQGIDGPKPGDLDLSWLLDVEAGRRLLQERGVFVATTTGNVERGTLAMKVGAHRIEITTLRQGTNGAPLAQRIADDLGARDMTIGALAVEIATGKVHDPLGGLADWQRRCIVPVGNAEDRVREHPVRWLRYYRKARQLGFSLDRTVRRLHLDPRVLDALPKEAPTGELRAALLQCASPGRFLLDLQEAGLLFHLAPELAWQFDGRPAGPQQWHPEISQGLHLVLSLEWAAARTQSFDERDRLAVMVAVLGHDLGKGLTPPAEWPGHAGHEHRGLKPLDALLARFPGLADQRTKTLAAVVCELHVLVRELHTLRPGTLARLYDEHFRAKDFPLELFAIAVGADSGGRLGLESTGETARAKVAADLQWLRSTCERVDAAALRAAHPELSAFRAALHEARARAIAASRRDVDPAAE